MPATIARPGGAAWPRGYCSLAAEGVYFGTSSWKYEGWLGTVYDAERYVTRGKFSQQKFEADCLAEYATTFPVVCGDFAFYQFPSPEFWKRLFGQTPPSFLFGFKVPEEITVARWPGHARFPRHTAAAALNEESRSLTRTSSPTCSPAAWRLMPDRSPR